MTVRSILNTKGHQVTSVAPDTKLSAAAKLLGERKIGAVLVMNQSRLEGILSERDIVRVLAERGASALERSVLSSAIWSRGRVIATPRSRGPGEPGSRALC